MSVSWQQVALASIAALIAAIPAIIAAWYGRTTKVQLKTGNDKTVGEMVTEVHGKESQQSTEFETHRA